MTTMSQVELFKTGGSRGNKVGLGFTYYEDHALRKVTRPPQMDKTVRIAGVRVTGKFRLFGGVQDRVFYTLWFDPNHEIVPD